MNLDKIKLPVWLDSLLGSMGWAGIFAIGFLDSSVLSFPVINDLLVITFSIRNPALMPLYAAMATLGSLAGSLFLYYLARKGGEAMLRKRGGGGARSKRIHEWLDRHSFLAIAIPSILPPPMPFKIFVATAGALEYPRWRFMLTVMIARSFRYYVEGTLAVFYGERVLSWIKENGAILLAVVGAVALVVLVVYFINSRRRGRAEKADKAAAASDV